MFKIARQVLKFSKAWVKWKMQGSERRSKKEVMDIFYIHCEPCGHYHPELGECTLCECSVSPNSDERNKIVYKTEHCPPEEGKW